MFGTSFYGDKRKTRTVDLGLEGERHMAAIMQLSGEVSADVRRELKLRYYGPSTASEIIRAAVALLAATLEKRIIIRADKPAAEKPKVRGFTLPRGRAKKPRS